ncbi:Cacna1g, partial [Symbiodinium sp. KB8]
SAEHFKSTSSLTAGNLAAHQKGTGKDAKGSSEISRSRSTGALQQVMPKVPE